jgi:AmmeMemoRadiSam system protein A
MMIENRLTQEERNLLLRIARRAIEKRVAGEPLPPIDFENLPHNLQEPGASFVTLTLDGALRGCIGTLEPYQPLAEDVQEHAVAAALSDYRFPPVQPAELHRINIEISRLTPPKAIAYQDAEELVGKLRPGIDGVVLKDNLKRATFLPQVWEKIPVPQDFLNHLCLKMGVPVDSWRSGKFEVLVYQVEEFHEN